MPPQEITNRPSPLPKNWLKKFFRNADLETSYQELESVRHFHAETMRGRIRSLQMRFSAAWEHFDRAQSMICEAPRNTPNLVRQFVLEIYSFNNALLERPVSSDCPMAEFSLPPLDPKILDDYPEIRYVLELRRNSEAMLRLHTGELDRARAIYNSLLNEKPMNKAELLVVYYLGLAACEAQSGMNDEVEAHLESSSLAAQTLQKTLNQASAAAQLNAFYKFTGNGQKAMEWKLFLSRLGCPQETIALFTLRAEKIHSRCSEKGRLVLL